MTFTRRTLGTTSALEVSALGLGCMGMSEFYGTTDEQTGIDTIHRALDLGVTFLDTADMYGPFTNEQLVGKAIAGRRDEVQLATKFGNERNPDGSWVGINGSPDYVRRGLRRLAAAARRGPPRPLLPAPRRQDRPDRGDRRRDEGAGRGRQGPPPRPVRGRGRHDPPGARRAPDHRAADRVLAVHPRPRGRDPADDPRARASAWCPTRRSAAASSPAPSPRSRSSRPTRGPPAGSPGSQGEALDANLALVDKVKELAARPRLHARPARPRLGPGPGRRRRSDPGHQAGHLPRGEPRRHRRRSSPTTTSRRSRTPSRATPWSATGTSTWAPSTPDRHRSSRRSRASRARAACLRTSASSSSSRLRRLVSSLRDDVGLSHT